MTTQISRTANAALFRSASSISLGTAILAAAVLSSGPAIADPDPLAATAGTATGAATPAKGGGELEEIVVTAEKRESTVQATPIAMTALSAGDLSEQNIGSIQDLVGAIPGISLRTAGPGQTEYEMRGLASSGGSVATVGFYLDETPLSASAVALNGRTVIDADLFDLNRTEVLRGPQGTLYGAGSMGGTIKLVTNQPKLNTVEGGAEVDASYTSGASTNGRGSLMVNLPIGDIAAFRFVTTDKYVSGWITRRVIAPGDFPFPTNFGNCGVYYCTRGDVQDAPVEDDVKGSNLERFISARGSLLIQPMDTLSITGNFMYQRIDADGYNVYQSPPGYGSGIGVYQPYDISEPYYDSFHLWSLKISYDMGFANLTSASSYWSRFVYQSQDSTEALQNIFNYTNFVAGRYVETDPTWQIAQEIRLTSRGEGDFQWVGGLYYSNLHSGYITYNQEVGYVTTPACPPSAANPIGGHCPAAEQFTYTPPLTLAPNPEGIMFNDNNPNILNQKAIFGEVSYKLRPDLKLTAGLRFYKFEISNEANQAGLGTASGDATPTIDSARGSNTSLLPKLNLSYEPNPDLTVYSTLSKGSRPGGVNLPIPLNPTGFYYCGGPAPGTIFAGGSGPSFLTSQPAYYAPDDIWSLEVGEKSRLDDRRFTVNADVFYVKWHNIQQLIVLSCGYPYNTNVGDAKTYGPEVELAAKVTDELTVDLSGAYTQAYISAPRALLGLSEEPSGVSGSPPVYPGQRINSIPKYTGDLAVIYETMLPQEYKFRFRAAESYVGPVQDTAYYRQTLGPYGLMDFRVGVGKEPWTASLFGTNLTNKHAALTIDNTVFAWQQPTITRVSTNQPRTVGLAFETKF